MYGSPRSSSQRSARLDARSGAQLFKTTLKAVTHSTPMTYAVRGKHCLAFVSGSTIVAVGFHRTTASAWVANGIPSSHGLAN